MTDDAHPTSLDPLAVTMVLIGAGASADDLDPDAFAAVAAITLAFFDFIGMLRATFLGLIFCELCQNHRIADLLSWECRMSAMSA